MFFKIYDLKDPRTGKVEEVYEYPTSFLPTDSAKYIRRNCITVSREVMKFPILSVPLDYLTERKSQRINSGIDCWWSDDFVNYYFSLEENLTPKEKFNRFVAKVLTQLVVPIRDSYEDKSFWWELISLSDINDFTEFVKVAYEKKFPWNYIKNTVEMYHEWNQDTRWTTYKELMVMFPLEVISDTNELEIICDKILAENEKSVEDYRKGKKNSINHLKGQVMKATKGKANANVVSIILERKLNQ